MVYSGKKQNKTKLIVGGSFISDIHSENSVSHPFRKKVTHFLILLIILENYSQNDTLFGILKQNLRILE